VARDEGIAVAYLPGLAMRRIADLHAGEAKADARDAAIIAGAARCMSHTLRSLKLADEQVGEFTMLCGFDDDLVAQMIQTSNHLRGLLTQIHPALGRVIGPRIDHPAVLDLLERYPSPERLAALTERQLAKRLLKLAPRMGNSLAAEIVQALSEQSVVVHGTKAARVVVPTLARQLLTLRRQREVESLVQAHPLFAVLMSMPGVDAPPASWRRTLQAAARSRVSGLQRSLIDHHRGVSSRYCRGGRLLPICTRVPSLRVDLHR
jgi:hypothetical protein